MVGWPAAPCWEDFWGATMSECAHMTVRRRAWLRGLGAAVVGPVLAGASAASTPTGSSAPRSARPIFVLNSQDASVSVIVLATLGLHPAAPRGTSSPSV